MIALVQYLYTSEQMIEEKFQDSDTPSREVIIGIALVAPVLLGLLLRFYLLPNTQQANNGVGNNAVLLIGGDTNGTVATPAQPTNAVSQQYDVNISNLDSSQVPTGLFGQ